MERWLGGFIMRGRIVFEGVKMFTGINERGIKWPGKVVGVAACPGVASVQGLWKRKSKACGGCEALIAARSGAGPAFQNPVCTTTFDDNCSGKYVNLLH